jgi:hypothetical protein
MQKLLTGVSEIPLETANRLYAWGWKASLVGAIITAVGVILLMLGTRVRDRDFESRISKANVEAAHANERAALLELQAAQAKLELEKLRKSLGPRRLTPEQREKLTAELSAVQYRVPKVIIGTLADGEVERFAMDIAQAMSAANIQVEMHTGNVSIPPPIGISIKGDREWALATSFVRAGVEFEQSHPLSDVPSIFVGVKEQPEL